MANKSMRNVRKYRMLPIGQNMFFGFKHQRHKDRLRNGFSIFFLSFLFKELCQTMAFLILR